MVRLRGVESSRRRTGRAEDKDTPPELPAVVVLRGDDGGRGEGGEELGEEGGHADACAEGAHVQYFVSSPSAAVAERGLALPASSDLL